MFIIYYYISTIFILAFWNSARQLGTSHLGCTASIGTFWSCFNQNSISNEICNTRVYFHSFALQRPQNHFNEPREQLCWWRICLSRWAAMQHHSPVMTLGNPVSEDSGQLSANRSAASEVSSQSGAGIMSSTGHLRLDNATEGSFQFCDNDSV